MMEEGPVKGQRLVIPHIVHLEQMRWSLYLGTRGLESPVVRGIFLSSLFLLTCFPRSFLQLDAGSLTGLHHSQGGEAGYSQLLFSNGHRRSSSSENPHAIRQVCRANRTSFRLAGLPLIFVPLQ